MSVKGLHKMIYPFAPDQSGAVSVLYEMGGMIIICDAGGCAGNICGFDEPRWLDTKSAVFSAGLRDMDAILGRDDLMIEKITRAAEKLDARFIAIIGTPVPATIATDYKALRRMAEKRTGLPVLTMDTSGAKWYDEGIGKAYRELLRNFAPDTDEAVIPGSVGVLGVTPLDTGCTDAQRRITDILLGSGASKVLCYGAGHRLEDLSGAARMEKNIVTAPSGFRAARYLKERFGTPYEAADPLIGDVWESLRPETDKLSGRRILIIHQQIRANALRDEIRKRTDAEIDTASWFAMYDEFREPGDIRLREEYDFTDLMEKGIYDVVIADESLAKAARSFRGTFIDFPHFAVSGRMAQ